MSELPRLSPQPFEKPYADELTPGTVAALSAIVDGIEAQRQALAAQGVTAIEYVSGMTDGGTAVFVDTLEGDPDGHTYLTRSVRAADGVVEEQRIGGGSRGFFDVMHDRGQKLILRTPAGELQVPLSTFGGRTVRLEGETVGGLDAVLPEKVRPISIPGNHDEQPYAVPSYTEVPPAPAAHRNRTGIAKALGGLLGRRR